MIRRLVALVALPALVLTLGASPIFGLRKPAHSCVVRRRHPGLDVRIHLHIRDPDRHVPHDDAVVDPATGDIVYIPAAHQALDQVIAERDGVSYMVVGRETYNDLKGHLTLKLMFVGKGGGIADNINVVFRTDRNGAQLVAHDLGSCSLS